MILGDVNLMAVASHDHANVDEIGANDLPGDSLTDPVFLYTINEPGVCNEPGNPLRHSLELDRLNPQTQELSISG